jgi:hypothetical protein
LFIYLFSVSNSGATNPEYVVTADDVDKLIAVECIPMDDKGHQVFFVLYAIINIYLCMCGIY